MSRNDPCEVSVHLHFRTDAAVLVSDDGVRGNAIWLPLSLITIHDDTGLMSGVVEIELPEWLAIKEGLV